MMSNNTPKTRTGRVILAAIASAALLSGTVLMARQGGDAPDDRTDRITERAARDAADRQEREARDQDRATEERAKIMEDAAKDPEKAAKELAELEEDIAEDAAKAAEDAAKDAADFAEDLAKEAEDREDGSSREMRDTGSSESPDFDRRGFPVRRGEIVALDMKGDALEKAQKSGFTLISQERLPSLESKVTRLGVPSGMRVAEALQRMKQIDPAGTFDYTHYYGLQYTPSGIAAGATKDVLPRKKDKLTIGMIDTGVMSHPALSGLSISARDFAPASGAVPRAHGTAVASILVSEGSSRLYVANIFRGGTGAPFTSADAIVRALEWMVASKVPVVNISLAGPRNAILDKLVDRSISKGTLIVAAAGNGGPTAPPAYPAALGPVIAVTAVDAQRRIYRYANQGRYISVSAFGVGELAAEQGGGFGRFSGTSFAAPHVSAWFARCLKSSSRASCAQAMRKRAIDLGTPGFDTVYGHGLLQ